MTVLKRTFMVNDILGMFDWAETRIPNVKNDYMYMYSQTNNDHRFTSEIIHFFKNIATREYIQLLDTSRECK